MSQQQVGQVYSKIIDETCDASQIDFEEGGVDSETLKLLKQRWQKKLSALEVGQFPWEPQTSNNSVGSSSTPAPQSTPNISSNPPKSQQHVGSENGRPSPAPPSNQGSRVKTEAGQYQPTGSPSIGYPISQIPQPPPAPINSVAQQRAAQALQQQYGSRAAPQINQLQQSSSQRQQSGLPNPQYQDGEDRKPGLPHFSPPVPQSRTPLQSAQQDGAHHSLAEWKAEVSRRRAMATETPARGERLFRQHMLQRQQQIEGGGLLLPLDERYMPSAGTKRRVEALFSTDEERVPAPPHSSLSKVQGDAPGDDDVDDKDLDEDAINSDLDDPDDAGGDPEDETVEQVMLCTYDKVQRVKNKWKCTLKDGILRVANKEYVFHKGQGEFEW